MAVNSISSSQSSSRMLGLSGIDTQKMIDDLMKVEKIPIDRLKQKKQLAEWKRDAYREVTSMIMGLKSDFFDVIKPDNNMLSGTTYKKLTTTSSDSTVVTAVGSPDAVPGSHTITVNTLAAANQKKSSGTLTKDIVATTSIADFTAATGMNFIINVDGIDKTIDITGSVVTVADLQNAIDSKIGINRVDVVDVDAGPNIQLKFVPHTGSNVTKITLKPGANDALSALGFGTGANLSNRLVLEDSLQSISTKLAGGVLTFSGNNVNLTINGKAFSFANTTTLSGMMSQISSDTDANVKMEYDVLNDRFVFTAADMGSGNNIQLSETGSNFLSTTYMNLNTFNGTSAVSNLNYSAAPKKILVAYNGVEREITLGNNYANVAALASDLQTNIQAAFSGAAITVAENPTGYLSITAPAGSTLYVGDPLTGTSAISDLGFTANYTAGRYANVVIDGQMMSKDTNEFDVKGVSYKLLKTSSAQQTIEVNIDVDAVYNNIKNFVGKYNDVIAKINDKISQKPDRDYQPLTDDQKATMSEADIKAWESKAKEGLLWSDPLLRGILDGMRKGLLDNMVLPTNVFTGALPVTNLDFSSGNKKFLVDIDGVSNEMTLSSNYTSVSSLASDLQTRLQILYPDKAVTVAEDPAGHLKFTTSGDGKINIGVPSSGTSALYDLGLTSNSSGSVRSLGFIGISTGSYEDKGKLNINEAVLRDAIRFNTDTVMNLFSRQSSITANINLTPDERSRRYNEEGIAYRVFDVIDNNIRTIRDVNGKKGLLLEKAGMEGDASDYTNTFFKEISDYDIELTDLYKKYDTKQESYYEKFARLESAISQMNAQSAWLSQQFSSGQG